MRLKRLFAAIVASIAILIGGFSAMPASAAICVEPVICLPGPTVTVRLPAVTVSVPGPRVTVTVPGAVRTVTRTVTENVAGPVRTVTKTVSVPGAGSNSTVTQRVTVPQTVTVTKSITGTPVPGSTVIQPGLTPSGTGTTVVTTRTSATPGPTVTEERVLTRTQATALSIGAILSVLGLIAALLYLAYLAGWFRGGNSTEEAYQDVLKDDEHPNGT